MGTVSPSSMAEKLNLFGLNAVNRHPRGLGSQCTSMSFTKFDGRFETRPFQNNHILIFHLVCNHLAFYAKNAVPVGENDHLLGN